ncbi:SulP family inorganic anion transporter [Paraglaciecola chathamensis]|uniref:Sodium-independent anion transporter n=2 Tax=Paraglaciecola chathamensis TaxID=368405 RepID=A0A8H9IDT5_9ALTE|nr:MULTISPECIES: SulP family inorganic anion transporter [Paraglaciecola]MBN24299.1 SulP family inorganic anion transporter [Alteromonadaceae bacterium]GAC09939.1 sulfate transporter [Paraglaciecola chathamensis S18K6]GGZ53154.1 sodium-independent anion transporter [Paraglaciecola oceanifecundans]|tara:strand:+ start:7154 stop:8719 length:1566 start_codon:yes stop_codon:yes gene_type:complete
MIDITGDRGSNVKNDVLSGITVALALVPEAVAFAFVAGVEPMVGLYAAFMMGLITSAIGGRPGMISGATGAMAVVMVALVAQHGVQYLFAAVLLAGLLQILAGVFKLGKFIRLVPYPVMLGFVNGLAIVIFLAQLGQFKITNSLGELEWMQGSALYYMLGLVGLTMAIIFLLPKLTKAVPASLVAIVTVTLLVHGLDLEARTVIDFVRDMLPEEQKASATLAGELPSFAIPMVPFNLQTLYIILPTSVILALVGLIESLLTLSLIDEMTDTRGSGNRECVGQGVANTVNGVFGGMGGCAMIGQSMININSGGRGRLSGITAALVLLGFILFAAPLIEMIPLAALVGVMFIVVIGTFEWASFRIIRGVNKEDAFVLFLVTAVTVIADLAIAVVVGVIVSALVFAWKHAKHISAKTHTDDDGWKVYELQGPLFFGSVSYFKDLFDPQNDPQDVVIDFNESRVWDSSGVDAIDSLADKYQQQGKKLHIRHISAECRALMNKAQGYVEMNLNEDPRYKIATDKLG